MKQFKKWTLSLGFLGAAAAFSTSVMGMGAQLNSHVCYLDIPASRHLVGKPLEAYGKTMAEAKAAVVEQCETLTRNSCEAYRTSENLACTRTAVISADF